MRMITKIVLGFTVFAGLNSAFADSPEVDGFRYHLANTDCGNVTASRAFGLRVMGWDFPVPSGYDFRGFDRGFKRDTLWLQKLSDVEPLKYLGDHPGSSVREAVRRMLEQEANIYYYEAEEDENLDGEEYRDFEAIECNTRLLSLPRLARSSGTPPVPGTRRANHSVRVVVDQAWSPMRPTQ